MAFTYSKLAESTVGAGGTTSVAFNNIPQNYTDLIINISIRSNRTFGSALFDSIGYRFNDTAVSSNYNQRYIYGDGSAVSSSTLTTFTPASETWGRLEGGAINAVSSTSNTFASINMYIPNYASANNKSFSVDVAGENNATTGALEMNAGLWSNTTAITNIAFRDNNLGNIAQYSTFTLYGVKAEV